MASERVFSIRVLSEFAAAHHIRGYDGDCARPHGHNYKIEVEATTTGLNSIGLAIDFKDLKKMVKGQIERFDHQDLNTIPPFDDLNPTAEVLAQVLFQDLEKTIAEGPTAESLELLRVTVWENDRSAASFGRA